MDSKHWIFPFQESYDFMLDNSNVTDEFWETLLEDNKHHIHKVQEWQIESQEIRFDEYTEEAQKHIPYFLSSQSYDVEVNTSNLSNTRGSMMKLDSSCENSQNAVVLISGDLDPQTDVRILKLSKNNKVTKPTPYNMNDDRNANNTLKR